MLAATAAWAAMLVVIHWTLLDTNPMFSSSVILLGQGVIFIVTMVAGRRAAAGPGVRRLWALTVGTIRRPERGLAVGRFSSVPLSPGRLALMFAVLTPALFPSLIFSAQLSETAVTVAVTETGPLAVVVALWALHRAANRRTGGTAFPDEQGLSVSQATLGAMMLVGVAAVGASQSDSVISLTASHIWAVVLAMGSAVTDIGMAASVVFGAVGFAALRGRSPASLHDRMLQGWLSLLPGAVVWTLIGTAGLAVCSLGAVGDMHVARRAAVGLAVVVAIDAVASTGIRLAYVLCDDPWVQSLACLAPFATQAVLLMSGVELARMWLFFAGGGLLLASGTAIQLMPMLHAKQRERRIVCGYD